MLENKFKDAPKFTVPSREPAPQLAAEADPPRETAPASPWLAYLDRTIGKSQPANRG
jgi:hypothetical protein